MASLFFAKLRSCVVVMIVLATICARATADEPNYSGHYELTDAKAKREFLLDVKQNGDRAEIAFSAAMSDGTGAAPDGMGKGHVEDGVLSFKFKDSFNNEGTCTLQSGKAGYQLSITVLKVVDPGPFHFYGNMALKKTSDKPESFEPADATAKNGSSDALPK